MALSKIPLSLWLKLLLLIGAVLCNSPSQVESSLDREQARPPKTPSDGPMDGMGNAARILLGLLVLATLSSTGCSSFRDRRSLERLDQGYTILLPGIQGESILNGRTAQGLVDAGLPTAIEVDDWTSRFAPAFLLHLRSRWRHEREANRIAGKITDYARSYPGRPIYLVGHSGGAAMVVYILERLPVDVTVTRAVLLAPALSPEYDLTAALDATEGGIWSFYSPDDLIFCGVGTTVFGSIDGKFRASAGAMGFRDPWGKVIGDLEAGTYLPANGSSVPLQNFQWGPYLRQVPYRPEMITAGNLGGHFGWVSRRFSTEYIAPLLKMESAPW